MKIKKFLIDQKKNAEKVKENKRTLQEAREMELEELKEQIIKPRNGDYDSGANLDYVDINYKLVEEASPNYTMKGRYNHVFLMETHRMLCRLYKNGTSKI